MGPRSRLGEQPALPLGQGPGGNALALVADAFDPARLTQARRLAGLTKRALADLIGVSPVAVGQWESGGTPRPDHVGRLAQVLEVPPRFFTVGRPYAHLDGSVTHFRSLRRTPAIQRDRAKAFAEQVWEVAHALEKRVQLPPVDLPGFADGETSPDHCPQDPVAAARALREHWSLAAGPIPRLVRIIERHGVLVTLVPFAGSATATVDAFSAPLPRPILVLTPDRADDVYRHRFTAAHELGHLLLHGDPAPGDPVQEKQADAFAAELLTPGDQIGPQLPRRFDTAALDMLSKAWGVSVDSLIYRCRELGVISEASYRRAYQRLKQLRGISLFPSEPVEGFPGEIPVMLPQAFTLAEHHGLTLTQLADELSMPLSRLRLLLGDARQRPELKLA